MKIKTYLTYVIACLVLLSACGGNKLTDPTKPAGLSACKPSSGPTNTKVICEVDGMTQDSTLFFDKQPIQYTLNVHDGAVSFTVPPSSAGEKIISFQESEAGVQSIGTFQVTGGATGIQASPTDADGDGVSDASDACPGTAPGTTIGSDGCPSAPTSAIIENFDVAKSTNADAKMSSYVMSWNFANAKAAYLFGNVFNRDASDAALPEADRCKLSGDRYLATGSDGKNIDNELDENAADSNLKKTNRDYLEGFFCNNSNDFSEDDCNELLVPTVENNPWCRIDLKKKVDATLIPTGSFTTRSLAQYGRACIAVQGTDAQWVMQCKNVTAPSVALNLSPASVVVSQTTPVIQVNFSYDNAVSSPSVTNCTKTGGSDVDATGHGTYQGECKIDKDSLSLSIAAQGIGVNNVDSNAYTINFETPEIVQWNIDGAIPPENSEGPIKFKYSASRKYTIKDKSGGVSSGSCPWMRYLQFSGRYLIDQSQAASEANATFNPTLEVKKPEDATGQMTGYKSPPSTSWFFRADGFDNTHQAFSSTLYAEYPVKFEIYSFGGHVTYDYSYDACDHFFEFCGDFGCCDPSSGCGCRHDSDDGVWGCYNYVEHVDPLWRALNIQYVYAHCDGSGINGKSDQYWYWHIPGQSLGSFHLDAPGENVTCRFTAITVMGTEITVTQSRDREASWCDGPDHS